MKIIVLLLTLSVAIFAKMEISKEIENFNILNQFEKNITITNDTKKLIFVFTKANGHIVKNYLSTKSDNFLDKQNTIFVADVSAMPSIIAWFVLPKLKDNKFSIAVLKDDEISKKYKSEENEEKIVLVYLNKKIITDIRYLTTEEELKNNLKQ